MILCYKPCYATRAMLGINYTLIYCTIVYLTYYTVMCCAVLCCAVICCAVLCYTVLCCAILYHVVARKGQRPSERPCCAILYFTIKSSVKLLNTLHDPAKPVNASSMHLPGSCIPLYATFFLFCCLAESLCFYILPPGKIFFLQD